ncbi:uncharacterized protein LOC104855786 isoform X2 [Fukomys damarensis]|uniref:uncharacterized protein LOC104855786 isoform X2 n=1 Tax=Fukomys damarensis TaxID=885580 RepID=UPI00053F88AA|nr:uncharacterized protein LOC104855786 isoform X2 [Fukomys damarensis]
MHRPQWAWGSEGYQTPSRPHTVELDHRSRMSQAIGTELQPVRHGQQSHFCTGLKTAGKRGPAAAWPVIRTLQDTSRWCLHKTSRSQRDPGCSVPIRKRCRMEGWDRHEDLAHASIGASARTLVQRSRALLFLPFCETTDSKMNIKHVSTAVAYRFGNRSHKPQPLSTVNCPVPSARHAGGGTGDT